MKAIWQADCLMRTYKGHNLGNSHDNGGAMGETGGSRYLGHEHLDEMLSRAGIGNAKVGVESGKPSIKSVIGEAPKNFNSGRVIPVRKYNRLLNKMNK